MAVRIGERVPNFRRLDASQSPVTLYQDLCARRTLLVADPEGRISRQRLEALAEDPEAWTVLLLRRCDPQQLPPPPDRCVVLADDGAVLKFLLADGPTPAGLVLDRNFRLLHRLDDQTLNPQQVRAVYADEEVPGAAPVLVVPRVLDADLVSQLVQAYREENEPSGVMRMENGRMVYAEDPSVKIRREHRLQPGPLWDALEARLQRCLLPEIQWAFNYRVTRFEGVKVVCYDAGDGGYFSAHRDNDGEDTAHRRFALTVNLNPRDYEGGELVFPEYGDRGYRPGAGSAVVFSCNLAHEARPVTRGVRLALVSFFFSDAEDFRAAEYENRVRGG